MCSSDLPPKSADPSVIAEKARMLGPVTDALNITDNQTAQSRMCPLASGRIALDNGAEPVMQMTVRDTAKVQEALGSVDFQSR